MLPEIHDWPEADEWGTPKEKMPDCPKCGADELGLIRPEYILCYCCGFEAWKESLMSDRRTTYPLAALDDNRRIQEHLLKYMAELYSQFMSLGIAVSTGEHLREWQNGNAKSAYEDCVGFLIFVREEEQKFLDNERTIVSQRLSDMRERIK